jgi:transcriptional regulator with XRE-family HTH domain
MAGKIVLPLSLTDLVQSLRELIGLTKDLADVVGDVSHGIGSHRRSKAASLLGNLGFGPRGSKGILAKLAAGNGSQADLEQLKKMLAATDSEIESAIAKLAEYGPFLEKEVGLGAKWELDDLIHQAQPPIDDGFAGKIRLRREIKALSEMPYDENPEKVRAHAQELSLAIRRFNETLLELYERIRTVQP